MSGTIPPVGGDGGRSDLGRVPRGEHARGAAARRRPGRHAPRIEELEPRRPLAATPAAATDPALVLESVTTRDSQSVTVTYDRNLPTPAPAAAAAPPLVFGVYRSADDRFDASDRAVAVVPLPAAARDDDGRPASDPGRHVLTIPLPGGLPPDPRHPYVLLVADPDAADPGASVVAFRVRTIGVVTHGGMQDQGHPDRPPEWERVMAATLRRQGYDAVIAFNWVAQSDEPGAAARQGRRLARQVLAAARQFPPTDPVDLHFIGHSEGTVVNSQAIRRLEPVMPPPLQAGYLKLTMLDPHAANTGAAGQQYSVSGGLLGGLAKGIIDDYQARADDPPVFVPAGVDAAEVFYQHTPASRAHASNHGIYNLWGQVPVRGPADYFNLTAAGATHSGPTSVTVWYQKHVVPQLGDGAPQLAARVLTGALDPAGAAGSRPVYSGTAQPGATVVLFGGPARAPAVLAPIARTTAGPDGRWSVAARPLADGRYRVVAVALPPRHPGHRSLALLPTAPLGLLVVAHGASA